LAFRTTSYSLRKLTGWFDRDASGGSPPCGRCKKDGRECVLGGSNRGGSRIRKKNLNGSASNITAPSLGPIKEHAQNASTQSLQTGLQLSSHPQIPIKVQLDDANNVAMDEAEDDTASTADSALANAIPRNPSDAWQLLKDVANRGGAEDQNVPAAGGKYPSSAGNAAPGGEGHGRDSINGGHTGIATYRLVREGYLIPETISMLVARYAEHYHPYLPLVPRKYFDPAALNSFAINDKHLLTAVLTISSKDLTEQPNIHSCCSRYMHDLISGIAAGHDCEVEAVEALLLLAEWEPQGLRNHIETVGRGEEDRSAWMHVGMALRTGYFLGLDRTSFRSEDHEETKNDGRKRLAWASCYVADRLISVRIGRAFWSRGPGPMTGLSSQDFPSLQPLAPGDEDYARVFQATLDLTQLYSNVHDVLYSGMRTSGQMMLMGDYVKYVDEFRASIAHWNRIWGNIDCSPHIKVTLQMSYEYLRLYTNAFAFQAAISQAISNKPKGDAPSQREHLRNVFSNIGAKPDNRFIWASVAAAKSYLSILNTYVHPVTHLRYMPLRFYLYAIYSAVFLYKARSFGVMDAEEERTVRQMVLQAVSVLKQASVSPEDPGSRYARLLELLWLKPKASVPVLRPVGSDTHSDAGSQLTSAGSLSLDQGGYMQFSPANGFSWLDLEAVGDYVAGDQMASANLLAPMSAPQQMDVGFNPQMQQVNQWQQAGLYNWQVDLNGNLLF
jgi:hypothetical protein